MCRRFISFALCAFFAAVPLVAADGQQFVLLPLLTPEPIAGANGTSWDVATAVHNGNDVVVAFGPCNVPSESPCPPSSSIVGPHETIRNPDYGLTGAGRNGRLVYIHQDLASRVTFNARVFNRRAPSDRGTEIPLPRSEQFSSRAINLLNVPMDGTGRVTLRIYDPDDRGDSGLVAVRIFRLNGDAVDSRVVRLTSSGYPAHEGMPFAPSFAEILLVEPGLESGTTVRIEVEPLVDNLRIWAFVTITDNVSQQVTVVSPM